MQPHAGRHRATLASVLVPALALTLTGIPAAAATKVLHYQPRGMHVTQTYRGSCGSPSGLTSRPGAYLCTAHGHGSYDPCFADGHDRAACPVDVVNNSGIVVTATKFAATGSAHGAPDGVWAMRLTQGQFCIYSKGLTGLHGYPYSCGLSACSAPAPAPLNATYQAHCSPLAGATPAPRPFFVATIWR